MKKILIITDICISQKHNAGNKNALLALCEFLRMKNYTIDIINFHYSKPDSEDFKLFTIYHYPDFLNLIYRKTLEKLKLKPKLLDYKKSFFRKLILRLCIKKNYDAIFIEYIENHHLINECRRFSSNIICDLHDVMYLRKQSFLENNDAPKKENLNISLKEETDIINKFNAVLAIEESEKNFLIENNVNSTVLLCKRTIVKNNILKIKTPILESVNIGFIGSAAEFNITTILSFIAEIWNPYLSSNNYTLIIGGNVCNHLIKSNTIIKGNYKILGRISEIEDFYSKIHLSINPVISGSGFKTKNAESLSYGVPIITSMNGIKGFESINERYCKTILEHTSSEWIYHIEKIKSDFFSDYNLKIHCHDHYNEVFNIKNNFKELEDYLI